MIKRLLALLLVSPLALCTQRATIDQKPILTRGRNPQTGRFEGIVTVSVSNAQDTQKLKEFIVNHPFWKEHGNSILDNENSLLIKSGLTEDEIQKIVDAFNMQ